MMFVYKQMCLQWKGVSQYLFLPLSSCGYLALTMKLVRCEMRCQCKTYQTLKMYKERMQNTSVLYIDKIVIFWYSGVNKILNWLFQFLSLLFNLKIVSEACIIFVL